MVLPLYRQFTIGQLYSSVCIRTTEAGVKPIADVKCADLLHVAWYLDDKTPCSWQSPIRAAYFEELHPELDLQCTADLAIMCYLLESVTSA